MEQQDFTTTILVDQRPDQVFDAINNPQDWWTGAITGSAGKLNDEFTYSYKDFHTTTQRVVEMIPGEKVVWLVTDSQINYAEDKREWLDTKISFEITEQGNKTQLRFTHIGLGPQIECFDSCSNAWTELVQQGLYNLITTGKKKEVFLG